MNYDELQREVRNLIDDASTDILLNVPIAVNEAVAWVAEEADLPTLKTFFSLTTIVGQAWVNFPDTFSGRLTYCGTSDGEISIIEGGLEALVRLYPTLAEDGDVEYVAVEGSLLWYQPIPSDATVLSCVGFNITTDLVLNTDIPSSIPVLYHRSAIVNKAVSILYDSIEDALEGGKPNTMHYRGLAEIGLNDVRTWVSKRRVNKVVNTWSV